MILISIAPSIFLFYQQLVNIVSVIQKILQYSNFRKKFDFNTMIMKSN
jgi:hypothetical protein